jgi:hypothetical protein
VAARSFYRYIIIPVNYAEVQNSVSGVFMAIAASSIGVIVVPGIGFVLRLLAQTKAIPVVLFKDVFSHWPGAA